MIEMGKFLQHKANEALWLKQNPDYECMPADIITFLGSPDFGDPKEIRPKIKEMLIDMFSGKISYNEAIIDAGIGTGKSYFVSKVWEFLLHRLLCLKSPALHYGLAKDTKIYLINMSTKGSQAKDVVFEEFKHRIDNASWFKENGFEYDKKISSKFIFPKGLEVIPGNSEETFPLGYNIFCGILDEAAWHLKTREKDYAEEGYNNMRKRVRSRFIQDGLTMAISSPRYVDDFIETKMDEAKTNPHIFSRRLATWEALPLGMLSGNTFDLGKYLPKQIGRMIPIEYEQDFKTNPERSLRDFGAIPSEAIERYLKDTILVEAIFKNALINGINDEGVLTLKAPKNTAYYSHCDLGYKKDRAGFVLIHIENGKAIADIVYGVKAAEGSEIKFSVFEDYIKILKQRGFRIEKATYDGWQSIRSIQALQDIGIAAETLSVDRTLEPYDTLKDAIYRELLEVPENDILRNELLRLELIKGKKVDHPAQSSKDIADALCGALYNAMPTLAKGEQDIKGAIAGAVLGKRRDTSGQLGR